MSDSLFLWLVYPAALPLDGRPQLLGELSAPTLAAAKCQAAERWPGVAVLIQSAASARVRSLAAPRPAPVKRTNAGRPRPGARGQLDAFTQAKRAAHAAARRDTHPTRSEE